LIVALLSAAALWGTLLAVESSGQSSGLRDRPPVEARSLAEPSGVSLPFPDGELPRTCIPPDCRPPSPGGGNGPAILVSDACVAEGDSETRNLTFIVSRVVSQVGTSSVHFATGPGTATAGADYTARSGTVTFQPGQEAKTVAVSIKGDTADEADETVRLRLSGAVGAVLADVAGIGTILDDDGGPVGGCPDRRPRLRVRDACTVEGDSGLRLMQFDVLRSGDLSGESLLNFGSEGLTATPSTDFNPKFGTFRFQTGQTRKFARIEIVGDDAPESSERLRFFLFNVQASRVARGSAVGTIVDDDSGPLKPCGGGSPALSITDARIVEGDDGAAWLRFDIHLSSPSSSTVTVHFETVPGTAKRGSDYGFKQGTFTFQPGQTAKFTRIKILGDRVREPDEKLTVRLSNPVRATIRDAVGEGTIVNDD
jgi:hypothetical protein